jgi:hypothetical protein
MPATRCRTARRPTGPISRGGSKIAGGMDGLSRVVRSPACCATLDQQFRSGERLIVACSLAERTSIRGPPALAPLLRARLNPCNGMGLTIRIERLWPCGAKSIVRARRLPLGAKSVPPS